MDKKHLVALQEFLETQSMRELFERLYNFGYNLNFTYCDDIDGSYKAYLRALVIGKYYDFPFPVRSISELKEHIKDYGEDPLSAKEEEEIRFWFKKLGVGK